MPRKESFFERPIGRTVNEIIENYVVGGAETETNGTEINIPKEGPLVCLFIPHSGWLEAPVIDFFFRKAGRPYPYWVTKKENNVPSIIMNNRLIYIDREQPDPGTIKEMYAVLQQTNASLATSLEGTRFGNPQDRSDVLTLGPFKSGLVRVAANARAPILPAVILGTDKVLPDLDKIWKEKGLLGAIKELQQTRENPQPVEVRFLPVYTQHLENGARSNREKADFHTEQLARLLVESLLLIDPDYPLGSYEYLRN